MNFIAMLVYIIVQIIFIPFAIIGVIIVYYKQILVSKKLGVSQTAIEIINGRWTMHLFGMRDDVATVKLIKTLPNTSIFGLWLFLVPFYLQYKISGKNKIYPVIAPPGNEGVANILMNRTVYFDSLIGKARDGAEQFVIMGAGLDTRCYGDLRDSGMKCFELDQTTTQQFKIDHLHKADIDTSHVTFVEVDFSTDHWYQKLEAAGYDPATKTIFLWEGVTLYISEADVRNTLKEIKAHSGPGSMVIADMYALGFVTGDLFPAMKKSLALLKLTDEEFGFGIDFASDHEANLKSFLESEGAKLEDAYFIGSNTKKGIWMVVAEIVV